MAKTTVAQYISALKPTEAKKFEERLLSDEESTALAEVVGCSETAIRRWRQKNGWVKPDPSDRRVSRLEKLASDRELELRRLKRSEAKAWAAVETLERTYGETFSLKGHQISAPKWVSQTPKKKGAHVGTPVLFLSDLHLDEIVDAREMNGMNEYNREIAEARFQRTIDMTVEWCKTYTAGIDFEGVVVPLGGDIFSGTIHEELERTNEATMPESVRHWVAIFAAGIKHLADEFGSVYLPCVTGNHGRTYKRIPAKQRATSSWEWVFYHWLSDLLLDDGRITFQISRADELLFPVHDTTFLLQHGDQTNGGHGIAGVIVPIMRWVHKTEAVYAAQRKTFDYAIVGHWHQLTYHNRLVINGSLKGYDEYAKSKKFGFERAQQALWVVTPENGITSRTQIFADPARGDWS